jgi:hypothetical protein
VGTHIVLKERLHDCNFLTYLATSLELNFKKGLKLDLCDHAAFVIQKPPNRMPLSPVLRNLPQIFYSPAKISWRFHLKHVMTWHLLLFHFPHSSVGWRERLSVALTVKPRISEVYASNLGQVTGYTDGRFRVFFSLFRQPLTSITFWQATIASF